MILIMNKILLHTGLGLALCSSLFAGKADEIAKKHAVAKAADLEAYLKANPKSIQDAYFIQHLLEAYALTNNTKKRIALLQKQLDNLNFPETQPNKISGIVEPLIRHKIKAGDQLGAKKILDTVRKKSEGHKRPTEMNQALSNLATRLEQQLEQQLKIPNLGETMEVKFTSLQGEKVDLAAMKGKVVLIDFWATWCVPCIAELPHVFKAYEKYHDQGFEVIGISLDTDKAKLEKFIKDRKMPWPQSFDGKGWRTELVAKYGIKNVPATFLIGPDGTVVATNLRGDHLVETVKKHLPK